MTIKTLTGHYASGYSLKSTYSGLVLSSTAYVGDTGVRTSAYVSIVNYGDVVAAGQSSGITLTHGGGVRNGYYTAGHISGYIGVEAVGSSATIRNYGVIGGYVDGVRLQDGGTVINADKRHLSAVAGTITGDDFGVEIYGGAGGTVVNGGTISESYSPGLNDGGGVAIVAGSVNNYGLISAIGPGVSTSGDATVTNSGTIRYAGGYYYGAGSGFAGVTMSDGGFLTNGTAGHDQALIQGREEGVGVNDVAVVNFGTILGSGGVVLEGDSSLVNGSAASKGALIEGPQAVDTTDASASVINLDTIEGTGGVTQTAVYLDGGVLTNGSGADTSALITAYNAVTATSAGTVRNFGLIEATGPVQGSYGVNFSDGGTLINGSASSHAAVIEGYAAVRISGAPGSVSNFGTIESEAAIVIGGVYLIDGGSVTNGSGADRTALITGYDGVAFGGTGSLVNFGTISASNAAVQLYDGAVTNGAPTDTQALIQGYFGVFAGGAATIGNFGTIVSQALGFGGVLLEVGGTVTNGSGGDSAALISGAIGVITDYGGGADAGTVVNYATISGSSGAGVDLVGGGSVTNGMGPASKSVIEGVNGIEGGGGALRVSNSGLIDGSIGDGVRLVAGGTVTNGAGGVVTALIEGVIGVSAAYEGATVNNFGTILAEGLYSYGVAMTAGGVVTNGSVNDSHALIIGYEGVSASASEVVINFGTIEGSGGTAVNFGAATDDLEVEAGATFVGAVIGGGGTIDLASGTGTITSLLVGGNVVESGSSTTFSDFGTAEIGAGASFSLAGTGGTIAAGEDLIIAGTLGGTGTLTLSGGTAAFDAGTDLTIAKVNETAAGAIAGFYATSLTVSDVWDQTAGTVSAGAGDKVAFTGTGDVFSGTLAGAGTIDFTGGSDTLSGTRLTGTSVVVNGASVTLSGTVVLADTFSVTSPDLTIAATGATLSGSGSLSLSTTTTNEIEGGPLTNASRIVGTATIAVSSLTNSGTIQASSADAFTINTGVATVINSGIIENTSTGGLTIDGAVSNTGNLEVTKGTLTVDGSVSGAGKVTLSGGTVDLAGAFSGAVTYTSTGGVLVLAHSKTDTVTITGFPKTNIGTIDLQDIKFSGATETFSGTTTSGVLTIKNGANIATITLEGNYTTSTFTLSADSSGGTIVTDPVKTVAGPPPLQPLVSAIAGFGASTGGGGSHPTLHTPDRVAPLLASAA